jgi:hypothetical protein
MFYVKGTIIMWEICKFNFAEEKQKPRKNYNLQGKKRMFILQCKNVYSRFLTFHTV